MNSESTETVVDHHIDQYVLDLTTYSTMVPYIVI